MQKMTTCLWFDNQGEEAAKYYTSIFPNSEIGRIAYYGEEGTEIHGRKEGSVMTVEFTLNGNEFLALNGGPIFKFSEAISMIIYCEDQKEVDYYWEKLGAGGDPKAQQCGWVKDKYGLSWQVTPTILTDLTSDPDRAKADRVFKAMLKMKKINIEELKKAAAGK